VFARPAVAQAVPPGFGLHRAGHPIIDLLPRQTKVEMSAAIRAVHALALINSGLRSLSSWSTLFGIVQFTRATQEQPGRSCAPGRTAALVDDSTGSIRSRPTGLGARVRSQ
jgi:hypothetical protein